MELAAIQSGDGLRDVTDVTHDSRQVREGTLFVAIKGGTVDGHRFVDDVMRRGVAGIISESDPPSGFQGTWLKVNNAREALAKAAAIVNGTAIHGDFKDKFIRAEVIEQDKLLAAGSYAAAREKGLVRTEGKEYIVKDGDVIEFKI